jgi:hypothetical protein
MFLLLQCWGLALRFQFWGDVDFLQLKHVNQEPRANYQWPVPTEL